MTEKVKNKFSMLQKASGLSIASLAAILTFVYGNFQTISTSQAEHIALRAEIKSVSDITKANIQQVQNSTNEIKIEQSEHRKLLMQQMKLQQRILTIVTKGKE